jgi:hypothetical protein
VFSHARSPLRRSRDQALSSCPSPSSLLTRSRMTNLWISHYDDLTIPLVIEDRDVTPE